jgi:hypothetical protein
MLTLSLVGFFTEAQCTLVLWHILTSHSCQQLEQNVVDAAIGEGQGLEYWNTEKRRPIDHAP